MSKYADNDTLTISRSKLENFTRCPRCFYLDVKLGVSQPSGFPFTLNNAVDHLLKKEFDIHRAKNQAHPLMDKFKIKAKPFNDSKMDYWREKGIGCTYEKAKIRVWGKVDDVWIADSGELHIVDYKATAKSVAPTLDADWQISYKRQAEIYQWLFRGNGFKVSDTAYFVYVNGRRDAEAFDGRLEFDLDIIPYKGSDAWIEPTLKDVQALLVESIPPEYSPSCDYCSYLQKASQVNFQNRLF